MACPRLEEKKSFDILGFIVIKSERNSKIGRHAQADVAKSVISCCSSSLIQPRIDRFKLLGGQGATRSTPKRAAELRAPESGDAGSIGAMQARSGKLYRARSRLYRSQILQVNMRLKALAEIYTMHSFAPFSNLKIFVKNC